MTVSSPIINEEVWLSDSFVVPFGTVAGLRLPLRLDPRFDIFESNAESPSRHPTIDPILLEDVGAFVDDPELWFQTPNTEFEGRKPIEMLGTPDEARLRNRIEASKLGLFS